MLDRLPALIASVALLILSLAAFAAATSPARAQALGPAFSGGDFPLLSWGAVGVPFNQTTTLYTVPAGKRLIVKTFCTDTTSWGMGKNGVLWVNTEMTNTPPNDDAQPMFCLGKGNAVYEAGDVLTVETTSSSTSAGGEYYVEAMLVAG
jgi:hypothetical protein